MSDICCLGCSDGWTGKWRSPGSGSWRLFSVQVIFPFQSLLKIGKFSFLDEPLITLITFHGHMDQFGIYQHGVIILENKRSAAFMAHKLNSDSACNIEQYSYLATVIASSVILTQVSTMFFPPVHIEVNIMGLTTKGNLVTARVPVKSATEAANLLGGNICSYLLPCCSCSKS